MFSELAESLDKGHRIESRPFGSLLHQLLAQLVDTLSVRRAHIAAAISNDFVRLVAAWQDGAPAPVDDYPIANTPCAEALASGTFVVVNSHENLFPNLPFLGEKPVLGYTSYPIVDSAGAVVAHICLLSDSPIQEGSGIRTALALIADRIVAEAEHERRAIDSSNQIHDTHAMLANLPGMVYRCRNEPGWPMQFVSDGCIALCGYSPEALIEGKPGWRDIIHPDDRDVAWKSAQSALKGSKGFEIQYRIETSDKQCKWVLERGCSVGEDGSAMLVEGFVSDVTPLHRKKIELEHAEALARSIVESVADGVIVTDDDGRIELMNKEAAKMFGVRHRQATGRTVNEFLRKDDCAKITTAMRQFGETHDSQFFASGMEIEGVRADGSVFPIHVRIRQLPIGTGSCYVASVSDISEQKAYQTQILQQHERMNATIEFAPIGIITFDRELKIIAANPAFARMIGYDPDEIVGSQVSAFTHADEIANMTKAALKGLAEDVSHFSVRTRYIHKDGHIVHAVLHVALGYDAKGRPEFGVANVEDLTLRLSAEALIKNQQAELARLDRLSSLGEMTAGIAHEINQPLTAISTYAQAAVRFMDQGNADPERLKQALERLSDQSLRASAVIERIRELSRQRQTLTESVDCNALVTQAVELIGHEAASLGIKFHVDLADGLPCVLGDPIQIQQVILNLVRNAIDSMQRSHFSGGHEIRLTTEKTYAGQVRISVVDSGHGVDESAGNSLFQPFSTSASTGLGMGLPTGKSIMKLLGGKIEFRNNPTKGATFYITLPGVSGEIDDE